MADSRGSALLLVVGRLAARCGDVVAIASTISGRGIRTSLSLSADRSGRSGKRLAMVWTVKTSAGYQEGEERAKMAAASFALVLSLPSLLLALLFCFAITT